MTAYPNGFRFSVSDAFWFQAGPSIPDVTSGLTSSMTSDMVYASAESELMHDGFLMAIDLWATQAGAVEILVQLAVQPVMPGLF